MASILSLPFLAYMAYWHAYMPVIDIIDSAGNDYRYNLPEDGTALLIGSGEECSISLPHITDLLPQHCTIALQEEGYVISAATEGAVILAENEATAAVVLVPGVKYSIGSATVMYSDSANEATVETTEEPERPKKKKKKSSRKKSAGDRTILAGASYTEEDSALHIIIRRLYVIAILAGALLAGMTLRYWMITGEYLIDELLK